MAHHLETRQTDPPIRPSLACARVSAHLSAARRRAVSSFAFDRVRLCWLILFLASSLRFAVFHASFQRGSGTLWHRISRPRRLQFARWRAQTSRTDGLANLQGVQPSDAPTCRACSRVSRGRASLGTRHGRTRQSPGVCGAREPRGPVPLLLSCALPAGFDWGASVASAR